MEINTQITPITAASDLDFTDELEQAARSINVALGFYREQYESARLFLAQSVIQHPPQTSEAQSLIRRLSSQIDIRLAEFFNTYVVPSLRGQMKDSSWTDADLQALLNDLNYTEQLDERFAELAVEEGRAPLAYSIIAQYDLPDAIYKNCAYAAARSGRLELCVEFFRLTDTEALPLVQRKCTEIAAEHKHYELSFQLLDSLPPIWKASAIHPIAIICAIRGEMDYMKQLIRSISDSESQARTLESCYTALHKQEPQNANTIRIVQELAAELEVDLSGAEMLIAAAAAGLGTL